ncbi:unnamed protein product [Lactuca saligna]|uniref:Uncharacterized protein n=1 Tax=Lactuca saligna TaxID=75948 RepID=A0AA35ZXL8_LACSI|nr:unnamed protein product [Lactuca saligna]
MTKGQLKKLNVKLDSILEHSNTFFSTKWENLFTTHRATIEILASINAKFIEESSKVIHNSKKRISEVTRNVEKLHQEVKEFKNDFRISSDKKTTYMNKDNEASRLGKDKGKGISEEEIDENANMAESEQAEREKKDKDLDELNALQKKLEAEEFEAKNA